MLMDNSSKYTYAGVCCGNINKKILITHRSDIDCITEIRNKQAP